MKKITVTLSDRAEKYFNKVMYGLPKNEDGTGMCTQSQAISVSLEALAAFEEIMEEDVPSFLHDQIQKMKEVDEKNLLYPSTGREGKE